MAVVTGISNAGSGGGAAVVNAVVGPTVLVFVTGSSTLNLTKKLVLDTFPPILGILIVSDVPHGIGVLRFVPW